MFRNVLMAALIALGAASTFGIGAAQAGAGTARQRSVDVELTSRSYVFGPYATRRRANEVANIARRRGYSAIWYHNGNGYYVRVW